MLPEKEKNKAFWVNARKFTLTYSNLPENTDYQSVLGMLNRELKTSEYVIGDKRNETLPCRCDITEKEGYTLC